jgi:hypothetical protein
VTATRPDCDEGGSGGGSVSFAPGGSAPVGWQCRDEGGPDGPGGG